MGICLSFHVSAPLPQVNYRLHDRREISVTNSMKETNFWQETEQSKEGTFAGEVAFSVVFSVNTAFLERHLANRFATYWLAQNLV